MRPARGLTFLSAAILAALAAILAVLLPAGTASAAGHPAARTRVWATSLAAHLGIRADRPVSYGQRLGEPAWCPFYASGACVAPEETAPGVGLSTRGISPAAGTRIRPEGIPDNWRITGTDSPGGTRYYDPSNPGNSVRVMQGNPNSPYPNLQVPYARWQQNGQPLDMFGNKLPSAKNPAAQIPLSDFTFLPELFQ